MTDPLGGTWYVVRTSLPLWRTRQNPAVTYTPLPGGRVLDAVTFTRRGQPGLILGLDEAREGGWYGWRGLSPLTRLATSRWRFLHAQEGWAVTLFSRTLFTPAGLDVYSRTPGLTPEQEAAVQAWLDGSAEARTYVGKLFAPGHDLG